MKKLLSAIFLMFSYLCNAQTTGYTYDFNDGLEGATIGSSSTVLEETLINKVVKIASNGAGPGSEFSFFFNSNNPIDMTASTNFSIDVRASEEISIRIDLIDGTGAKTNTFPLTKLVREENVWTTLKYDFDRRFRQSEPSTTEVDDTKIIGFNLYINAGLEAYNGNIFIDNIAFGSQAERSIGNGLPGVKVNQVGFYPKDEKIAIVSSASATTYKVLDETGDEVYSGNLGEQRYWSAAQDCVKIADFSDFETSGRYKVVVNGVPNSSFFDIKDRVNEDLLKASLKYYYYNRASTDITEEHGGQWARNAGHLDNNVFIHESAATEDRPEGTVVSGPKGWYDAGDYNKYIVNSGISTFTILSLYEHFWKMYDEVDLNIPESNNDLPDILDEAKWNLDWMLSMQDPSDGGVYFKLTSKSFTANILPENDNTARYMVGKSTSSALNFAAVMAVAYRVYLPFDDIFPGYATSCLDKAKRAYLWAQENSNIRFTNPSDVVTGQYGDSNFSDEFTWAASELYISTLDDTYYEDINFNVNTSIPGWNSVGTLAFLSLSHNKGELTDIAEIERIETKLASAISFRKDNYEASAYEIPFNVGNNDLFWGSNSVAANVSMVLLQDYYNTGDLVSFNAAKSNLDYLLGRNPLEYCFVTGHGTNSPVNPHHRPSIADDVMAPVPGMLVGGPNRNPSDDCVYESTIDAFSYTDQVCSFSTNEIAINWNAPLAFVLGAIEAEKRGIKPSVKGGKPVGLINKLEGRSLKIYPNPASGLVSFTLEENLEVEKGELISFSGEVIEVTISNNSFDVSQMSKGSYVLQLTTKEGVIMEKIIVH